MARPSYDLVTTRPKTFVSASELSAKQDQATSGTIGSAFYNGPLAQWVSSNLNKSNSSIVDEQGDFHLDLLAFLLRWWISGDTAARTKAISIVNYAQSYDASGDSSQEKRSYMIGLGLGLDFLHDDLTSGQRDNVASAIYDMRDNLSGTITELMDGGSAGDQAAQMVGAIALSGVSGYSSEAATLLNESLDFWFDADAEGRGRLGYNRYYMSDGGGGKGTHYERYAMGYTTWFLEAFSNGLKNVTLDDAAYDILTDASWRRASDGCAVFV